MSTAGSAIGGVFGAVVGFMVGGPAGAMYGAQLGAMAGTIVDPPKMQGPRLNDLTVQTAGYGADIPHVHGTVALTGNVFWIENNQLKESSQTQGGKGGPDVTTYSYSATFAVGLCEGPVDAITRIWVGGILLYDSRAENTGDVEADSVDWKNLPQTREPGAQWGNYWTGYLGTDTQQPDDRMEAALGVASGYPGLVYIVFKDYPLEKHGNNLIAAQVKVEVVKNGMPVYPDPVQLFAPNGQLYQNPDTGYVFSYEAGAGGQLLVHKIDPVTATTVSVSQTVAMDGSQNIEWIPGESMFLIAAWGNNVPGNLPDVSLMDADSGICIEGWHNNFQAVTGRFGPVIATPFGIIQAAWSSATEGSVVFALDGTLLIDEEWKGPHLYWPCVWTYVESTGHMAILSFYRGLMFFDSPTREPEYEIPYSGLPMGNVGASLAYDPDLDRLYLGGGEYIEYLSREPGANRNRLDFHQGTFVPGGRVIYNRVQQVLYVCDSTHVRVYDPVSWELLESIPNGTFGSADFYQCNHHGYTLDRKWLIVGSTTNGVGKVPLFQLTSSEQVTLAEVVLTECLRSGLLSSSEIDVSALEDDFVRGYRVAGNSPIRGAIDQLQRIWPFDLIQSGYTLKAVERGGASSFNVTDDDLGATSDGSDSARLTLTREMDSMLPARAVVRYLDKDRDYDNSEQYAQRINASGTSTNSVDVPIVLTADEAAQAAERSLYRAWAERTSITITLPPTFLQIEPADVINVTSSGTSINARVEQIEYMPDGVIRINAKSESAAAYSSNAVGQQQGPSVGQEIYSLRGSYGRLLDLPCLSQSNSGWGYSAAIWPMVAGDPGWSGGWIYRIKGSEPAIPVTGRGKPPSTVGWSVNALGVGRTDIVDEANVLTVSQLSQPIYSYSIEQVFSGVNWFAVGADKRWEIVGVRDAVEQQDGTWRLSGLLRGLAGSEWAMSTHQSADLVIWLDPSALSWVEHDGNTELWGAAYTTAVYKTVSSYMTVEQTSGSIVYWYDAENIRSLSPIYLNGSRHPTTRDWSLNWLRRSRYGASWVDSRDAMLTEGVEFYRVQIFSDSTFSEIVRTIEVGTVNPVAIGSPTAQTTYTSAQQVSDFGSNQSTLYVRVHQQTQIGPEGRPLQATITRG